MVTFEIKNIFKISCYESLFEGYFDTAKKLVCSPMSPYV